VLKTLVFKVLVVVELMPGAEFPAIQRLFYQEEKAG